MNLKRLQLNEAHSDEQHEYPEAMFVTDGKIELFVDGKAIAVNAGGMYIVPAGTLHSVETDGQGTVVIFD